MSSNVIIVPAPTGGGGGGWDHGFWSTCLIIYIFIAVCTFAVAAICWVIEVQFLRDGVGSNENIRKIEPLVVFCWAWPVLMWRYVRDARKMLRDTEK